MTKRSTVTCALVVSLLGACTKTPAPFLAEYASIDLLIENGQVLDGLGSDPQVADIVVVGDRIVFVGDSRFTDNDLDTRVKKFVDANGRTVAPGFIDLHAHGDPFETPAFENFLAMGVTTITLGQDGSSPEVLDLAEWLNQVDRNGVGTNLAMFVGHGTLRTLAGIGRAPVPEPEGLERMLEILDASLKSTFGMSTGLEYNPGLNAKRDELQALARVHVSHLKSVFGKGSDRADEILHILASARESGIPITADIYPYTASYTGIDIVFPVWAKTIEQFEIAVRERRDELAAYLRDRVNRRNGPEATLLGSKPYTGKTLAELAHELETPFEDVLIDVIGPAGASAAYFVMNNDLQTRLLADPFVSICSDGRATGFHPRGHGTFARVIEQYVVRDATLTLPEAVRKMTSFAAEILGITDRGTVEIGMVADLLIFDPSRIHATATYPNPHQLATGFDVVIVNGKVAREHGQLTDELFGNVLRPGNDR